MNKVLDITGQLEGKKRKKQIEAYSDKIEAVKRTVQCSSCRSRCAMCGCHLNATDSFCPQASFTPDFNLCESCRAEFEDFLKMTGRKKGSDSFWHNKEWMKLWSAWLDYRQAITEFRNSTEFKQMHKEFDK